MGRSLRKRLGNQQTTAASGKSGDLLSLLHDEPSDEKTGANATLGFTYQQWWATLKATDLYSLGNDFAVGVEFKEDVFVLDSPSAPTAIEFNQIKKYEQEGLWTLSDLLRPGPKKLEGSDPSPLGKLYSRRHHFLGFPTKLTFLSNVAFKVPLQEKTKKLQHSSGCGLSELPESKASEIKKKLSEQLGISPELINLDDFFLERTNLPLAEQDTFITGKLSTLSDTGKIPFRISRPHLSARMLASEFQQRSGNTDYANTFEKLQGRFLSRSDITRVLKDAESAGPRLQKTLEEAVQRLNQEKYHYGRVLGIENEIPSLCANLSDRSNIQIYRISVLFISSKNQHSSALNTMPTLGEMMEFLVATVTNLKKTEIDGLSEGYLNALSLLVIKNAINIDIFTAPTNQEPKEGS